jgi:ribonuclease BN (tRNA processing enzyme)
VEVRGGDGELVILDAGSGIRALGTHLVESGHVLPVHLFLTHRHSDHVLGLAHFGPLFEQKQRIHLCCGDGESASLTAFTHSLLTPPMFPYVDGMTSRLEITEWGSSADHRAGGLTIQRFTAQHPGEAAIFRLDDESGPLIAYAPDNELAYHDTRGERMAWRLDLARFLREVPVLVHDATYRHDELPRHAGWGHSSNLEAVRLALDCGARTLVLFHHHPDRDDDSVEQMLDECRTFVAREGSPLRVLAAWEGLALSV